MNFVMNTDQTNWEICDVIAQANAGAAASAEERYQRNSRIIGIILGTAGIVLGLTGAGIAAVHLELLMLVMALLLTGIGMYLLITVCAYPKKKEVIRTAPDMLDECGFMCSTVEYEITEKHLLICCSGRRHEYAWSALKEWDEYKNFIYIITKNDRIIIIDRQQLEPKCLSILMQLLKSNVTQRNISTAEQKGDHIAGK